MKILKSVTRKMTTNCSFKPVPLKIMIMKVSISMKVTIKERIAME